MKKNKSDVKNLTTSAICLALCLVLPLLTGQNRELGSMLCLMHIPVLLCGFVCGPLYAAIVGLIAPVLRFMLFGMPPIMPFGVAMCFELAVYGIVTGIMFRLLTKRPRDIYISLVSAMLLGRIVYGLAFMRTIGIHGGEPYALGAFMTDAFVRAAPGIALHIVLIPVIVIALQKARFIPKPEKIAE